MKSLAVALGALLLGLTLAAPAAAYCTFSSFGPPGYYGSGCAGPMYPYPAPAYGYGNGYGYGYPAYPYYPYPLPPAPSLGFGRGGIYGHAFIGRGDGSTAYTFPGADSYR